MSLSKQQLTVSAEPPRRPKCSRCRHHGIIVPQRGHMKHCPFLKCDCWKCFLITQRTRIAALQRNLKRAQSAVTPEDGGPCGASDPEDGAPPSATSGPTRPPSGGAPERAATATTTTTTTQGPLDLRSRPAAGGESAAGSDSRNALPSDTPYFGEFGQTAPLPVIHFPFRMSGHFPSPYALYPNYLLQRPWLPPMPAGLYNDLCRPLMLPHFQSGAAHYPPQPEPAPPPVFFQPLPPPETTQEELR